jgi:hypothetical protein
MMPKLRNNSARGCRVLIVVLAFIISVGCFAQQKGFAPEFKIIGRVSDSVVFLNQSTNAIWVEASRGFNAGRCGILGAGGMKGMQYESYSITIPDKGWVIWRFEDGTYKAALRTNAVDVSALPKGRNKGDLELVFTTNQTWKATLKSR